MACVVSAKSYRASSISKMRRVRELTCQHCRMQLDILELPADFEEALSRVCGEVSEFEGLLLPSADAGGAGGEGEEEEDSLLLSGMEELPLALVVRKMHATSGGNFNLALQLAMLAHEETLVPQPLCTPCLKMAVGGKEREMEEVAEQLRTYKKELGNLEGLLMEHDAEGAREEAAAEAAALDKEEAELAAELASLECELAALTGEMASLAADEELLERLEEASGWQLCKLTRSHMRAEDARRSRDVKTMCFGNQLRVLSRLSVLSDCFYIWRDGPFGTINGFRLGRLPTQTVEWSEVNAAWGQAALLLHCAVQQLDFKFSKYSVLPMGCSSRMGVIGRDTTYELYGSSGFSLFGKSQFDNAMKAFVACLNELAEAAVLQDHAFSLPYPIVDDAVGGMSIVSSGREDDWTKAMLHMLTDLKVLAMWCTREARRRRLLGD